MKNIAVIIAALLMLALASPAGVTAEGDQTTFRRLEIAQRFQERQKPILEPELSELDRRARVTAVIMLLNAAPGANSVGLLLR
ncbi:MAG: hypothetical protein AAGE80_00380 [Pseudomonadota bacterium]